MSGKQSWPELVGKPVDDAVKQIQQENSSLNVTKLKQDAIVTCDLQRDRVRVFYDDHGNVAREPHIA